MAHFIFDKVTKQGFLFIISMVFVSVLLFNICKIKLLILALFIKSGLNNCQNWVWQTRCQRRQTIKIFHMTLHCICVVESRFDCTFEMFFLNQFWISQVYSRWPCLALFCLHHCTVCLFSFTRTETRVQEPFYFHVNFDNLLVFLAVWVHFSTSWYFWVRLHQTTVCILFFHLSSDTCQKNHSIYSISTVTTLTTVATVKKRNFQHVRQIFLSA